MSTAVTSQESPSLTRSLDQSHQPSRTAPGRTRKPPKMAPFSCVDGYNCPTTRRPVICQLGKNAHSISYVMKVLYKKHKNCKRFQCPPRRRNFLLAGRSRPNRKNGVAIRESVDQTRQHNPTTHVVDRLYRLGGGGSLSCGLSRPALA